MILLSQLLWNPVVASEMVGAHALGFVVTMTAQWMWRAELAIVGGFLSTIIDSMKTDHRGLRNWLFVCVVVVAQEVRNHLLIGPLVRLLYR